jgi:hypothetical protein
VSVVGWVIVDNELERICEEALIARFRAVPLNLSGETEKDYGKPQPVQSVSRPRLQWFDFRTEVRGVTA